MGHGYLTQFTRCWLVCLLMIFGGCAYDNVTGTDDADQEHNTSWSQTASTQGLEGMSVESENGSIEVQASNSEGVEVMAQIQVRAPSVERAEAFAEQIQVLVERDGHDLEVHHMHPRPPLDVVVTVDYQVRCPRRLALALATVNGSVHADGSANAAAVVTVNGSVTFAGERGPVSLVTVNGSIDATMSSLAAGASLATVNGNVSAQVSSGNGSVAVSLTNGNVDLSLHEGYAGQLDARSDNGAIQCNLNLGSSRTTGNQVTGTIGSGGEATVELHVTNGTIQVDSL